MNKPVFRWHRAPDDFRHPGAALSSALKVDIGSPILRVSRIVFDADPPPVQHLLGQFRPDRYQIKLDLNSQAMKPDLI